MPSATPQTSPKTPTYRKRKGYTQALVTLRDAQTGQRKDFWLGEYNTPQSRERYHRIIAEWEATPDAGQRPTNPSTTIRFFNRTRHPSPS